MVDANGAYTRKQALEQANAFGQHGYEPLYFRTMLEAGAVDVLQADASRCLGITGFLAASRLCEVFHVPLSAHTAPSLHAHVACCSVPLVHLEYFHDHARLETRLFDGFASRAIGVYAAGMAVLNFVQ
jgi:L-alanine-DL-glutamate epimerase-like enolase superfamily enzyme